MCKRIAIALMYKNENSSGHALQCQCDRHMGEWGRGGKNKMKGNIIIKACQAMINIYPTKT